MLNTKLKLTNNDQNIFGSLGLYNLCLYNFFLIEEKRKQYANNHDNKFIQIYYNIYQIQIVFSFV